jgi:hypothetical protein
MKLEVGQTVYITETHVRYGVNNDPKPCTITKIGKKYFETSDSWRGRFSIDSLLHDGKGYSPRYIVWLSLQDYKYEAVRDRLFKEISNHFHYSNKCTLQQLRDIAAILNIA